jgi:hypothetical protein
LRLAAIRCTWLRRGSVVASAGAGFSDDLGFRQQRESDLTSMSSRIASRIMRTTIDIDDPVLREVRAIHEREGRSMGAVVSELLADALARRRPRRARSPFRWTAHPMNALVDLADKEAVYAVLDADRS